MSYHFLIKDDDLAVEVVVPGKYNPDILEDIKRRLMDMYREALSFRMSLMMNLSKEATPDE